MSARETTGDLAIDRLMRGVRARLMLRTVLRSGAVAVAAVAIMTTLVVWIDAGLGLPGVLRGSLRWLPALVLVAVPASLAATHLRATGAFVTRLIDERGGVGNLLSTYRSPNARGPVADAFRGRASIALRSIAPGEVVGLDARRLWGWAVAAALVALLSLAWTSGAGRARPSPAAGSSGATDGGPVESAPVLPTLGTITVRVDPPAYAGLPGGTLEEGTIVALPGSTVRIRGDGTARGGALVARLAGGGTLPVLADTDGWLIEWTVSSGHRGVSIEALAGDDVVEQRVLPLRLLRDRAPGVSLTEPDRDLVLATATGTIPVRARALDDYGVGALTLHWVHSRGSGESFDFTEGTWEWDGEEEVDGGREAHYGIPMADLDLAPGDVLHIRAMARDRNDVTGPGIGVSATRQIRISDDDELSDVTTLIGFPIEREREPLLSQRMIILLTEELRDTASTLSAERLTTEAESIADEQARLRGRIGEQIFSRATGAMQDPESHLDFEEGEPEVFLDELEAAAERGPVIDPETGIATIANVEIPAHDHDSDPIVAINRSLLEIYNYMWDAERALRAVQLDPSLVPQYLALDMLQELRDSERVFPRGRVAVPPLDVAAVRGSGEIDEADPAPRSAGPAVEPVTERVVETLDELLAAEPLSTGRVAAVRISGLALDLLDALDDPAPSEFLVRAAAGADAGDPAEVRAGLAAALGRLRGSVTRVSRQELPEPESFAAARFSGSADSEEAAASTPVVPAEAVTAAPFAFATVRYGSGDWDSAPLVPSNLIHSLVQYTELPVESEGVIVDLSSDEVFDHPFLYLTGHLPVFFDEAESRNLVAFVERGGFIFIDDHNHDIDGAFHRSVTSELGRLFGQDRLTPLPNDHELYTAFFSFPDGPPITGHELSGWGDGLIHRELQHVEVGGRIGVLYSNKDYSSEWSYHADNKRFLAVDNTRFGVNILVYALTR